MSRCVPRQGGETCLCCCAGLQRKRVAWLRVRKQFLKRIDRLEKNWKFSAGELYGRARWDEYQRTFSDLLTHTSTERALCYVIPSDHKWFSRIAVAAVLVNTLIDINPQCPTIGEDERLALLEARAGLEAEAPEGVEPDPYKAKHPSSARSLKGSRGCHVFRPR
jgi:Polyphosphate kinase 2 (PPK2)